MKRVITSLVALIVAGLVVAGAVALVKHKKAILASAPRNSVGALPVHTVVAEQGDLTVTQRYLAVVKPIREADIAARVMAHIEEVRCDEGDRVAKGDVLVVLDDKELRQSVQAVKAQVAQAQAELEANKANIKALVNSLAYWQREAARDNDLAKKGDIPASAAEATADRASQAQGKLDATKNKSKAIEQFIDSLQKKQEGLETRLTYCTIRSPYNGMVSRRMVDPGDLATPGKMLVMVEDRSQLKLAFDVPQRDLPDVKEGLDVKFETAAGTKVASLSRLFPSLDKARMVRAEVNLAAEQSKGLSVGEYVPVMAVLNVLKGVTLVPASCLVEGPNGKQHVFVVENNRLKQPVVDVIGVSADKVAVKGIEAQQRVVTSTFLGWALLSSGQEVEALQ